MAGVGLADHPKFDSVGVITLVSMSAVSTPTPTLAPTLALTLALTLAPTLAPTLALAPTSYFARGTCQWGDQCSFAHEAR